MTGSTAVTDKKKSYLYILFFLICDGGRAGHPVPGRHAKYYVVLCCCCPSRREDASFALACVVETS